MGAKRALLLGVVAACGGDGTSARPTAPNPVVITIDGGDAGTTAAVGADAACGPVSPYPAGPYGVAVSSTLRNYAWSGRTQDGLDGTVSLDRARDGCALAHVLVVRIGAVWCGTCRWHAGNGKLLLGSDIGPRVRLLDVIVRDRENAPAAKGDAALWQGLQDTPTDVAIDPDLTTQELFPPRAALPYVLVIDPRTMTLKVKLSNPTEDDVEQAAREVVAAMDGKARPVAPPIMLVDGRFTRDRWDLVRAMSQHAPPPGDTTNAFGESPTATAFGAQVFNDVAFSPSGQVSCASCHEVERQLTDGSPTSPGGVGHVPRNSPSLTTAAYKSVQFWDGRADSLWSQALMPIEAPAEFGSSRLFVAHTVFSAYRPTYESLFGPMPPLGDLARFPANGQPGDPAWTAMAPADQKAVTRVFVNIGKSIAAFERTFRGVGTAIEQYAGGDLTALTDPQKDGLAAFLDTGCVQCHWGPRLTDDAFHNLRFPTGRQDFQADRGRIDGIPILAASEFSAASEYSDDPSRAVPLPIAGPWTLGAFKTPSLRNVALTSPYGHGGNYAQLADVVELIRTGGLPADSHYTTGDADLWLQQFDPATSGPLVEFLHALDQPFAR